MTRSPQHQHWVLLGTAPASTEVWGLRRIEFPCGYCVPAVAFALAGKPLQHPAPDREVWAMAGFAMELARGGRMLSREEAPSYVGGYRPWLALFHHVLLDELAARNHSIHMWDRGVSIFYELWREAGQALGDLIPTDQFAQYLGEPLVLQTPAGEHCGAAAADYAHDAASIVPFMSAFMTLSPGDIYVQGPLAAATIGPDVKRVGLAAGSLRFEIDIA
jgi:2-keto-4-pentenoate hydratase/2-oxohepta-3-ene-1,7-dioic acid hydratase in catechol pathway